MSCRLRTSKNRRGAVLVLLAIMLIAILGLAALSIDVGHMYQVRRTTQTVADAAAEAAAIELFNHFATLAGHDSNGKARAAAIKLAESQGFSEGNVEINIPPLHGAFAGKPGYAEVIIKSQSPKGFSAILGVSNSNVLSRAVGAGAMVDTLAGVLVLDPSKANSFKLKGKNSTLIVAGDVIVNSKNKKAVQVGKKGQVKAENFVVAGGLHKNARKFIDAEVSTGAAPSPDPLSSLPTPTKGSTLKPDSFKSSSGGIDTYNLIPGTYKELKFGKDEMVNMAPGIYYVEDKVEFKGHTSVYAKEVMIYNAGKKGFKITTQGDVKISPPTSGPFEAVSLFQGGSKKTKVEFSKQNHLDITGIIYAPFSEVKFKNSTLELDDDDKDEDDDWDLEEEIPMEEEFGVVENSSIGAAIIAAKVSIGKGSRVTVQGTSINGIRPLLGLVE